MFLLVVMSKLESDTKQPIL